MITTFQYPNQEEHREIERFAETLERRILDLKELFFWSADNAHERRQNDEVRFRKKRKDKEFNYQPAISELALKLAALEPKKRREVMDFVLGNIDYKITGIYVNRQGDILGHHTEPFLFDFAQDPLDMFHNQ